VAAFLPRDGVAEAFHQFVENLDFLCHACSVVKLESASSRTVSETVDGILTLGTETAENSEILVLSQEWLEA